MDRQTGRRIFKLNMTYAGKSPLGALTAHLSRPYSACMI